MSGIFGENVIVHRADTPTQDGDGNDVYTYTDTPMSGVTIAPSTTVELVNSQTLVVTELHAIWRPAIALGPLDQVEVLTGFNADLYDVDGDPKQYRSSLTGTSVTDAKLKKAKG